MGVDLTLLPLKFDPPGAGELSAQLSLSLIAVQRRSELWPTIEALPSGLLSRNLFTFFASGDDGERRFGKTVEDSYGKRLRYATAGDLATLKTDDSVTDNPENRAVWAYLSELPADTKVGLFWH